MEEKTAKDYDTIMKEAENVYKYRNSIGDVYAFHEAFEYAEKQLKSKTEKG